MFSTQQEIELKLSFCEYLKGYWREPINFDIFCKILIYMAECNISSQKCHTDETEPFFNLQSCRTKFLIYDCNIWFST